MIILIIIITMMTQTKAYPVLIGLPDQNTEEVRTFEAPTYAEALTMALAVVAGVDAGAVIAIPYEAFDLARAEGVTFNEADGLILSDRPTRRFGLPINGLDHFFAEVAPDRWNGFPVPMVLHIYAVQIAEAVGDDIPEPYEGLRPYDGLCWTFIDDAGNEVWE